jgi:glycosyltransferase involved in cell wall biosynthesis
VQPSKGHILLFEALSQLDSDRRWWLWLAGGAQRPVERQYEELLHRAVHNLGIENQVRFLGERTDVADLMTAADLLCQTNERPEGFGLVLVEALRLGLPVIALDEGAAREIITADCGCLTSRKNLSNTLRKVIHDDALRERLGAQGPGRAEELCAPERQVQAIESRILGETV